MEIIKFSPKIDTKTDRKLDKACSNFNRLLLELKKKALKNEIVELINKEIEHLNTISDSSKVLKSEIKKKQLKIVKQVEQKAKIVVKHHYRNLWLAIGMSAFGLPLGIGFGMALDNMALLGLGLPIGMVIGMSVGINIDNKAKAEGRQLDFEIG